MDHVLEDINKACDYLPEDWGNKGVRVTKVQHWH